MSGSSESSTKSTHDEVSGALVALADHAWRVREHAIGKTRVGCAAMSESGKIFTGCNIEHRFRCHDVHAEVNALTTMIAGGEKRVKTIVIVADRMRFTPCGGCMDWIIELGGKDTVVAFQSTPGGAFQTYSASELMPHYPE